MATVRIWVFFFLFWVCGHGYVILVVVNDGGGRWLLGFDCCGLVF